MKLIQPFAALIQNGVELTFRLKAAGDTNIQMDILPTGKDSKTGVALPPKALIGTAAELDASLEEYLGKYAASVTTIADVVAKADEELQAVEKASSDAARKAVEDKRKTGKSGSAKTSSTTKTKSTDSGLIDDVGGDDDDDEGTTLNTTSTPPAAAPAADGAATGDALSKELFIL
ncbi:PRTRC system protein E [Ramlibacter albus]|uniref:PRTRC system protein E n=1 Tax=Ramlibacter albus TaxID=2079448 RepID=A0A923MDK9_9BURK|nr:PRTRC system protein E [Ramlibacter albus]MBC5767591.1 PRTRC system protein E [Ramlibacter albus]